VIGHGDSQLGKSAVQL